MIKQWLEEYHPSKQVTAEQALREIMQEIALAGLQRAGFFERAAFYGGKALRIFYELNRYSEDLDFLLLKEDANFSFEAHLNGIIIAFNAAGMQVTIKEKIKTNKTNIESAFLKSDSIWKELILENIIPPAGLKMRPVIKIKLEVDTAPPLGFETEEKLLLKPFQFYVKCFKQQDLFARKMHSLLFRKWKQRVKGRDWYDMEQYVKKGIALNLEHFLLRAQDSGDWQKEFVTKQEFLESLVNKIPDTSVKNVREDIIRFIPDASVLDIQSSAYFNELIKQLKFKL